MQDKRSKISGNPVHQFAPSGSSINGDTVDIPRSNGTLRVSFCRGSALSRLVVADRVCSQPMPLQIAGRISQYTDSFLNTQIKASASASMLLVILPRLTLFNELVSHMMCQSFCHVSVQHPHLELLLSICQDSKLLALISPTDRIGRKVDNFSSDYLG